MNWQKLSWMRQSLVWRIHHCPEEYVSEWFNSIASAIMAL